MWGVGAEYALVMDVQGGWGGCVSVSGKVMRQCVSVCAYWCVSVCGCSVSVCGAMRGVSVWGMVLCIVYLLWK